jgi:hypothetical protein
MIPPLILHSLRDWSSLLSVISTAENLEGGSGDSVAGQEDDDDDDAEGEALESSASSKGGTGVVLGELLNSFVAIAPWKLDTVNPEELST